MFGYRLRDVLRHPIITIKEVLSHILSHIKWAWQRVFRGWDDRVAMSMDSYLVEMIPQWIKRMKEYGNSYPPSLSKEKWSRVLDEISEGFKSGRQLIDDDFPAWDDLRGSGWLSGEIPHDSVFWDKLKEQQDEALEKFGRGMELFVEFFWDLWD